MRGGRRERREEEERERNEGRTDMQQTVYMSSIFKTKHTFVRPIRILVKEIFRMGVEFKWASLDFLLG